MAQLFHSHPAQYWHKLDEGRIQCDLCPRLCPLHEDQRDFCFVRARQAGIQIGECGRSTKARGTVVACSYHRDEEWRTLLAHRGTFPIPPGRSTAKTAGRG